MSKVRGPSVIEIVEKRDKVRFSGDPTKSRKSDSLKTGYLDSIFFDRDKKPVGSVFDLNVRIVLQSVSVLSPNTSTEISLHHKLKKLFPGCEKFFGAYWNSSPPPRPGARKSTRTTTGAAVYQAFEGKRKAVIIKIAEEMVRPTQERLGRFIPVTRTEGLQTPRWMVTWRTEWWNSLVTASGIPKNLCVSLMDSAYASQSPPESAGLLGSFFENVVSTF